MIDPKIALARLREKAIREGDGFGYPVSAKEFDEAYEIYLGKVIRDYPGDSENERNLRAVRSVGIYLWRKKTLEQVLPDLFLEQLSTMPDETSATTSADTARLTAAAEVEVARLEAAAAEAERYAAEIAKLAANARENLRRIVAAREEPEKALIAETPAQHPQAPQATTMIAGIPLEDWLYLKQADPETAKDLLKMWKIERAGQKAKALAIEQRMIDEEKDTSDRTAIESHSQAVERATKAETNDNERKNTSSSTVNGIHIGRVWMSSTATKFPESFAALSLSNDLKESVHNTTKEGKVFGIDNAEHTEHRFKKYRSQKQASRFQH
ncbi:hypothetical protein BELL_0685g00020 [Botrytis elliptica]|uniref:Uncharacterized protein n=1 Tax=Botrytis elliptica TaxID=278938 RepID=A0A4Z1JP68_9HELO|nr:hypothetical protein EAE99_004692 [Botrytis elliptica]TGO70677.1 hypothetical protein BELL_0685g00020 [Botrytis elliptica]